MQVFGDCAPSGGISIADWQKYLPNQAARTAQVYGTQWQGKL